MTPNPWRRVALASVSTTFASLLVMVVFILDDARDDREAKASSLRARMSACLAFNDDVAENVNVLNDGVQALVHTAGNSNTTPRDPEVQARVDALVAAEQKKFEDVKIQPRGCTPEAIEAFYRDGGQP